jgi:hypothetical protein
VVSGLEEVLKLSCELVRVWLEPAAAKLFLSAGAADNHNLQAVRAGHQETD